MRPETPNHALQRAEPHYPRDDQPLIAFTLPHAGMVERFDPAHRPTDTEDNTDSGEWSLLQSTFSPSRHR